MVGALHHGRLLIHSHRVRSPSKTYIRLGSPIGNFRLKGIASGSLLRTSRLGGAHGQRLDDGPANAGHLLGLLVRHDLDDTLLHPLQPLVEHSHVVGARRGLPRRYLVDTRGPRPGAVLARRLFARASDLLPPATDAGEREALAFLAGLGLELTPWRRLTVVLLITALLAVSVAARGCMMDGGVI